LFELFIDDGGLFVGANKKSISCAVKSKPVAHEKKPVAKPRAGTEGEAIITIDRRSNHDRRKQNIPVAVERRVTERRVKVNRRRQIDPTTCERDYSTDEIEFMSAMDDYKRRSGRMFPTCSEVLEVIKSLGYEKRVPTQENPLPVINMSFPASQPPVTAK
jgi:hypothetical protein